MMKQIKDRCSCISRASAQYAVRIGNKPPDIALMSPMKQLLIVSSPLRSLCRRKTPSFSEFSHGTFEPRGTWPDSWQWTTVDWMSHFTLKK